MILDVLHRMDARRRSNFAVGCLRIRCAMVARRRRSRAGGYHERIDFDGRPVILPRRSRVAARQAFCYSDAGRLGWNGPWRQAGRHALNFLRQRYAKDDGTMISTLEQDGCVLDAQFDLYNQAFALLAYACGHGALDPSGDWRARGYALARTLRREFAHLAGGFCEDRDGRLTPRANPHMHLLEAALAWLTIDPSPIWRNLADEIVALYLDRFIDRNTAALREYFASDWPPIRGTPGEVLEPGHHYEWAFLLAGRAKLAGRPRYRTSLRSPTPTALIGSDGWRSIASNRTAASTTRWRDFGRKPSGSVPV